MTESTTAACAPCLDNQDYLAPVRFSLTARLLTLVVVVMPFLGLIGAVIGLWGWGLGLLELGLFFGMYALTAVGITVGFHRLFTHRSFETSGAVQLILGILGSMALQGPLFRWVAVHRRHHQHSDRPDDPHSPHCYGGGCRALVYGLCHAHLGWLFRGDQPDLARYVKDLRQSRLLRVVSALFPVWVLLGLLLPTALGLLLGGWTGALLGFLWGGLVRIFFVHHVTWSINSVCHMWGQQPFPCHDQSRNNVVFGILALGEGWHNNHHAFPTSARHGLRWWELDLSYVIIRLLVCLGLAWGLKLPTQQALNLARTGAL